MRPAEKSQTTEFVNEEMMKILKRIKQSVGEGGGLTNEVKALVRELRGEVLGMGREIAKKLEQHQTASAIEDTKEPGLTSDEVAIIVEQGMTELRQHMSEAIRENRRQSTASVKPAVDAPGDLWNCQAVHFRDAWPSSAKRSKRH